MRGALVQTGYDPGALSKKHVNKRKTYFCLRLEHSTKRLQTYFSNTRKM